MHTFIYRYIFIYICIYDKGPLLGTVSYEPKFKQDAKNKVIAFKTNKKDICRTLQEGTLGRPLSRTKI